MRPRLAWTGAALVLGCATFFPPPLAATARRLAWSDLAPTSRVRLEAQGITSSTFASFVDRLHDTNVRRVRDGDFDHLIFYALQSAHVSKAPPIEPALSAKALVDALPREARTIFLDTGKAPQTAVPPDARARLRALLRVLDSKDKDPRVGYFRALVDSSLPKRTDRERALADEYLRAMRFLYEKEFVAQRSARPADDVAALYRTRGLSTDTAVEAGYVVYLGLGILESIDPEQRIRRVLIVGPGLDLAPRTALLQDAAPESYQPWAVIDALLTLGLARADDLQVVAADINPRVVEHVRAAAAAPPALSLISGIREDDGMTLASDYRDYFAQLGRAIGEAGPVASTRGHLRKAVRVGAAAARTLRAEQLDIVTERLPGEAPFDLAIATNILPYFDDVSLALALDTIAALLAPRGVFLHNEPRNAVGDIGTALGLPPEQSRQALIATVRGAAAPLVDTVILHRKR